MPRSFGSVSLRLAADLLVAAAMGELGEVSENATKALLAGGGGAGKGEGLVVTGEGLAAEGDGLAAIGEGATNGSTTEGEEVCNLTVVKPCRGICHNDYFYYNF